MSHTVEWGGAHDQVGELRGFVTAFRDSLIYHYDYSHSFADEMAGLLLATLINDWELEREGEGE